MKVYICTNHDIHYPVGGVSVVIAKNKERAQELLDESLGALDLKGYDDEPYTLVEINTSVVEQALILADGNY